MFAFMFAFALGANAQEVKKAEGYQFTDIKRLPTTSVKDQASAGTCWAWSWWAGAPCSWAAAPCAS